MNPRCAGPAVKMSTAQRRQMLHDSALLQTWGVRRPTARRARYALPLLRLLPIWLDGGEFEPRRAA